VPFAPIQGMREVVEDPQVRALGLIVPVTGAHGGKSAVRPPIQFDGQRAKGVRTAPLLDEHGADIRQALGADGGWPALAASHFPEGGNHP
jgi:crotonobetainyl-CoA:carnitine CoA-transferase CaiB-like acyl-CoA transferase